MIGALIQTINIIGYIIIFCGAIRIMKMLLFLLDHVDHVKIPVFDVMKGKKLYLIVLWASFLLFFTSQAIQVCGMILELDKDFQLYKEWYWYIKDFSFTVSIITLIRLIFLRLKLEFKRHGL